MSKAARFTIDRNTWLRGPMPRGGFLVRKGDHKMCCLGFYALACGVRRDLLVGETEYGQLDHELIEHLPPELVRDEEIVSEDEEGEGVVEYDTHQTALHNDLMNTNDDDKMDEAEREAIITKLFGQMGVTVTFVDDSQDSP